MSLKENDIYIENLIESYWEAVTNWNGKDELGEQRIQGICAELEEFGINPDKLKEPS